MAGGDLLVGEDGGGAGFDEPGFDQRLQGLQFRQGGVQPGVVGVVFGVQGAFQLQRLHAGVEGHLHRAGGAFPGQGGHQRGGLGRHRAQAAVAHGQAAGAFEVGFQLLDQNAVQHPLHQIDAAVGFDQGDQVGDEPPVLGLRQLLQRRHHHLDEHQLLALVQIGELWQQPRQLFGHAALGVDGEVLELPPAPVTGRFQHQAVGQGAAGERIVRRIAQRRR